MLHLKANGDFKKIITNFTHTKICFSRPMIQEISLGPS